MAKLSLQEQLLKSGLISDAQAKKIKSDKHKQIKQQQKNKLEVVDEAKLLAQQASASKLLKDRELNQLRKEEAEQKATAAQVRQLVEQNLVEQEPDGIAYHFNDTGKVKTIYVTERVREQLSTGKLVIVRLETAYYCISAAVAAKVKERDPQVFMVQVFVETAANKDDPYVAYTVPDDLMW